MYQGQRQARVKSAATGNRAAVARATGAQQHQNSMAGYVAVSAGLESMRALSRLVAQNSTANRHLETNLLVPRHGCASVRSVEA